MRVKGDKYRPIVEIIKVKGGLPTVIKVSGQEYALRHKDMYKSKSEHKGMLEVMEDIYG